MFPYIMQGKNLTVVIDNRPHTITETHICYGKIIEALRAQDWDAVRDLIEPRKVVINYGRGHVKIVDDVFYWRDEVMHNAMTTRMTAMLRDGFSVEPLAAFMENLMQNPSKRAVDELYGFLEKNNLPITPDGHFLAYKRVRGNYHDCHTGKMDNSIGKIVEMERNRVDDNRDRTCSSGLHFCSESYLTAFGGERTVIVKINPRDVVSIPSDYNEAKGRACRYEVIGEVGRDPVDAVEFTKSVQQNANSVQKSTQKTGNTEFYRGYHDGYHDLQYDTQDLVASRDLKDYHDGYSKGDTDRLDRVFPRYVYQPE